MCYMLVNNLHDFFRVSVFDLLILMTETDGRGDGSSFLCAYLQFVEQRLDA